MGVEGQIGVEGARWGQEARWGQSVNTLWHETKLTSHQSEILQSLIFIIFRSLQVPVEVKNLFCIPKNGVWLEIEER